MKLALRTLAAVGLAGWTACALAQGVTPAADSPVGTGTSTGTNETALAQATPPAELLAAASGEAATKADSEAAPGHSDSALPGVIPLIVMDDVFLSDAIKNLARQADLNYMLDPKVAFGQPGPDGKPIPQPTVSLRWENVTAQQALMALLNNYSLQLVEDPKTRIARITIKNPAAPDPLVTRIFQLKFASPTNIVGAVQNTFADDKRSKVVADIRTSQLVIVATERELMEVEPLIEKLDTQTKQVLIEARLLETSMNPTTKKGVDWTQTLSAQNVTFGNGLSSGTTTTTSPGSPSTTTLPSGRVVDSTAGSSVSSVINSVVGGSGLTANTAGGLNPSTFFLNADGLHAVLSFLNTYAEAKVISAPRTVTLDNEPARIEVTRASPIINVSAGTVNAAGGSTINYTNLGVILTVTPRISANNFVNLKVMPEVSRVFDTINKNLGVQGNFQADEYDIRRIETRVMIPSGNTLVLGGLVQDDVRNGNTKVPLLGDIPVLGYLFRSDTKSRQKSNLLVFLTPTIVRDQDFQPTPTDFFKNKVPTRDSVEGDWSAWDSGKPTPWNQRHEDSLFGPKYDDHWDRPKTAPADAAPTNP